MRSIGILGSTGSVGCSTVDLVKSAPHLLRVKVLSANRNAERLIEQAHSLKPELVAIADESLYSVVAEALPGTRVVAGRAGVMEAASQPLDWVMAAIVGCAGLEPVLAAIEHSSTVAIANKEALVAAGALVMAHVKSHGTTLLPVDSEHNAIFQVFEPENRTAIERLILTASGGPFRQWSLDAISKATPQQAVTHPNWSMGAKISVDSASMMNKGLEVIEAYHLFGMPANKIEVLVHPQSVIHSMVEYADGSILAQLGAPDMRTPIASALAWPYRMETTGQRLDLARLSRLDFEQPDHERFPALRLAYDALAAGPLACIALNAANEIGVEAFLGKKIDFSQIVETVRDTLEKLPAGSCETLDDILGYDRLCREMASGRIKMA